MSVKNDCKESNDYTKNSLRIKNKKLRKDIFSAEKNNEILKKLTSLEVYKNAKKIMAFYPLPYEIDLRNLFIKNKDNKEWYLPKYKDGNIFPIKFDGENSLTEGAFKIYEPEGDSYIQPGLLDVIILPALAADKEGNRLGYGKGCYDKFLDRFECKASLIVPIFDDLVADKIPSENFDKKINIIVSEKEIIYIQKYL